MAWATFGSWEYNTVLVDSDIITELGEERSSVLEFVREQLEIAHPRDDYLEFLQLVLVLLGEEPTSPFKLPGAVSHVRWMSKAIYSLKIWLFRDKFQLSRREKKCFPIFCLFLVRVHVYYWFTSRLSLSAARNDLTMMKRLLCYSSAVRDKKCDVYKACAQKFCNHLRS